VLVGRPSLNKLYSIKKITNFKAVSKIQVKLNFIVKCEEAKDEERRAIDYKVYLICDSYIGCDQEDLLKLSL
jgi:hypothetical protein